MIALNDRIRACRKCHLAGLLEDRESTPIARDPEPDAPLPRILLIGQARSSGHADRSSLRRRGGREAPRLAGAGRHPPPEFYRRVHFAAITRCYPGRLPGARGDRVPSRQEQELCRPWLDELIAVIQPGVILLVGLLAIRVFLGRVESLTAIVGTSTVRAGVCYIPLPHPSGVSRWLNEPTNLDAVRRAMLNLRQNAYLERP